MGNASVDSPNYSDSRSAPAGGELSNPVDTRRDLIDDASPSRPKPGSHANRNDPHAGRNIFWIGLLLGLVGFWAAVTYLLLM